VSSRTRTCAALGGARVRTLAILTALSLAMLGLAGLRAAVPARASTPGPVVAESDGWDQECALSPTQNNYIYTHYASIFWFGFYLKAENAGAWTTPACPDQSSHVSATDIGQDANDGIGLGLFYTGLQAPCNTGMGYALFSYNTSTAKTQGEDDASTAWSEAEGLGFPGNVYIYFDLEGYNTQSSSCNSAAEAFISGWDSKMNSLGGHPGVYGSACSSNIANLRNSSPDPAAIWPAWYTDPSHTSVSSVTCIGNGYWNQNQRIVQWANKKALSTTGNGNNDTPVDFDCADGPVMDIVFGAGDTLGSGCEGDQ
jgi:Rv2525c-like, glycoside hydrolase-like domain